MKRKESPVQPPYRPQVGELVKDLTSDQHVVHMDTRGGLAYVRPIGGGLERTVDPASLQPLPDGPMLVVRPTPPKPRGRIRFSESGA
ncbi:hypothetical protein ACFRAR_32040 [Kitasatospora sp. NPDC056651]|uniref:hypothetical protein n=1 Tax=Kitasatospora sp. NPDC056651 TaxID=3345892 RepID=UPI00368CD90F